MKESYLKSTINQAEEYHNLSVSTQVVELTYAAKGESPDLDPIHLYLTFYQASNVPDRIERTSSFQVQRTAL